MVALAALALVADAVAEYGFEKIGIQVVNGRYKKKGFQKVRSKKRLTAILS